MPAAELSLGPNPSSAGAARRFLASTLGAWESTPYGEDAVLLLSELVANAALHANTEIRVRVELKPDCLRLAVTDSSPRQPIVRHYSDESTTGRGLALVNALALRWGVEPHVDGSKTVWAEVGANDARRDAQGTERELRALPRPEAESPGFGGGEETTSRLHAA